MKKISNNITLNKQGMSLIFVGLISMIGAPGQANVVSGGHQNFNTNPSGLDFVTVHSSETLRPGLVNLGLFTNYAVNSLPYWNSETQGRTRFNDSLLGLDLNLGIGLSQNLEAAVSAPMVIAQKINADDQAHGYFKNRGNTLIRVALKYHLLGDDQGGVAIVSSVNFDRTLDNPYTGQESKPAPAIEFAVDTTVSKWALAANLGYRWLNPGEPIVGSSIQPVDDQVIGSIAASRYLPSIDTKAVFEIFASQPAKNGISNADRRAASAEFLAGLKHDWNHNLALHVGGGTELLHGISSPDWRAYAGVNYTFGPIIKHTGDSELPASINTRQEERLVVRNIQFEFDSDVIAPDSAATVAEIAAQLKQKAFKKIRILGHTDSIGGHRYNQILSLQRAEAIRRHFIEKGGFTPHALEAIGRGEDDPIADNGNFQGRQLNRRVEFILEK